MIQTSWATPKSDNWSKSSTAQAFWIFIWIFCTRSGTLRIIWRLKHFQTHLLNKKGPFVIHLNCGHILKWGQQQIDGANTVLTAAKNWCSTILQPKRNASKPLNKKLGHITSDYLSFSPAPNGERHGKDMKSLWSFLPVILHLTSPCVIVVGNWLCKGCLLGGREDGRELGRWNFERMLSHTSSS